MKQIEVYHIETGVIQTINETNFYKQRMYKMNKILEPKKPLEQFKIEGSRSTGSRVEQVFKTMHEANEASKAFAKQGFSVVLTRVALS